MITAVAAMSIASLLLSVPGVDAGAPLDTVRSEVASVIAIVSRPDLHGAANRGRRSSGSQLWPRALGLTFPPSLLLRSDQVIE